MTTSDLTRTARQGPPPYLVVLAVVPGSSVLSEKGQMSASRAANTAARLGDESETPKVWAAGRKLGAGFPPNKWEPQTPGVNSLAPIRRKPAPVVFRLRNHFVSLCRVSEMKQAALLSSAPDSSQV